MFITPILKCIGNVFACKFGINAILPFHLHYRIQQIRYPFDIV